MSHISHPVYYLVYLWFIFTPFFEWHVWAQSPDLTFDPLSIQSSLNTDIDPGTISPQDIETLQTFQELHLISTNDLHSFFESTFNANGIYGEQKDGSSVHWGNIKHSIDTHFNTDVSILWLSKQYQDWYESIETTKQNLLHGGDSAEQELDSIFQSLPESNFTWTKQDWEDFATSKGLLGIGIILMGLFSLWKTKKEDQDPLEEAGSDIQQLLRTHDAEDKDYRTFYWDVQRDVKSQQTKQKEKILSQHSTPKPEQIISYQWYWETIQKPTGKFRYRFSKESIADYNQYKDKQQQKINNYNLERQQLLHSAPKRFQNWSRYAQDYWNYITNKIQRTKTIEHKMNEIQKELVHQRETQTKISSDAIESFLDSQWLEENTSHTTNINIQNPKWIIDVIYRYEELKNKIQTSKEAIKNYERSYKAMIHKYRFEYKPQVQKFLEQHKKTSEELPQLEEEFKAIQNKLQALEIKKNNQQLNHWLKLDAESIFKPSYNTPLSETEIVTTLKQLEKASTTEEKNILIEYLKQDVPTVQNFLYKNVSRYPTYFPKYGLTYAPWYTVLMQNFRNVYLPQDKKNKTLYDEKRKNALAFFKQQQQSIKQQNQWQSFLQQVETSSVFKPIHTLVKKLHDLKQQEKTYAERQSTLETTDKLYASLERTINNLTFQKDLGVQKLQNAFEVYMLIQQNNLETAQQKWKQLQTQLTQIELDEEGPESDWWQEQEDEKQFYIQYGKTKQAAFAEWDILRNKLEQKDAEFTQMYQNDFAIKSQDRLHYVGRKESMLLQSFRDNAYPQKVVQHGSRDGDIGLIIWSGDGEHERMQIELLKYNTWFKDPVAKAETQNKLSQYEQELYSKREAEWETQYASNPPSNIDPTLLASHIIKRQHQPNISEPKRTIEIPIPAGTSNTSAKSRKTVHTLSNDIRIAYQNTENQEQFITLASQIIEQEIDVEREKLLAQIPPLQKPTSPDNIDGYNQLIRDIEQTRKQVNELDVILRRTVMRKQDQQSIMKNNESIAQDYYQQWVRNRDDNVLYNKYLTYNKRALESRNIISQIEDLETVQRTQLHQAQDQFNVYQKTLGREETVYGRYQNALTLYNTKKDQQEAKRKQIQETLDQMYAAKRSEAERYYYQEEKKKDPTYTPPETIAANISPTTKTIEVDENLYAFVQEIEAQKSVTFGTTTNTSTPWKNEAWVKNVVEQIKAGDPHVFTLDPYATIDELTTLYQAAKKEQGLNPLNSENKHLSAFITRAKKAYTNYIENRPLEQEKENIVNNRNYWQQKSGYILRHEDHQWLNAIHTLMVSEQLDYEEINWFSSEEKEALVDYFDTQIRSTNLMTRDQELSTLLFNNSIIKNLQILAYNERKDLLIDAHKQGFHALIEAHERNTNKLIDILNHMLNDGDTDPAELDYMQKFVNSKIARKAYELDQNEFLDYKRVRGRALEKYELHETDLVQDDIGFQSVIYENDYQVIVSFAGTDPISWKDWLNNALQGIGLPSKQYNQAYEIAKKINKNNLNKKLIFTGHSLGGGLAALAGAYTKQDTYTYNAAGVNEATLRRHDAYEESYDNIFNIITANDILTEWQTEQDLLPEAIGKQIQEKNNSFLDLITLKKSPRLLQIIKVLVGGYTGIKAHGDF